MAGASRRGPPEQRPREGALLGPVTRGRGDPEVQLARSARLAGSGGWMEPRGGFVGFKQGRAAPLLRRDPESCLNIHL